MRKILKVLSFAAACAISSTAAAQSPYWTLFGNGLLNTSTFGSSALSIPPGSNDRVNSMYDEGTGALIFTVTADGIFNSTGGLLQSFNGSCATSAISEIEILPIPSECNKYQVVYWATQQGRSAPGPICSGTPSQIMLMSYKVDASSGSPVVGPGVMIDTRPGHTNLARIVTGPVDVTTGVRNIYTIFENVSFSATGCDLLLSTMSTDGSISPAAPIASDLPLITSDLVEYNNIEIGGTPGTVPTIAYAYRGFLVTVDPASGSYTTTNVVPFIDDPNAGTSQVTGIEYVPDLKSYYVSYYVNNGGNGGLTLVNTGSAPVFTATQIPGTFGYHLTDLELANSRVYLVGTGGSGGPTVTTLGTLSYINLSSPTTIVTPSPTRTMRNTHDRGTRYYLQNQIDFGVERYADFYDGSVAISASWHTIHMGPRVDMWTIGGPTGGGCFPQQVCPGNLILNFNTVTGVTYRDRYTISWKQTDPCGVPMSGGSPLDYSGPSVAGPAFNIDLSTFGNGALGSAAASGMFFDVSVSLNRACQNRYTLPYHSIIFIGCPKPGRPLSVGNVSDLEPTVFPNPATSQLNIKLRLNDAGDVKARLLDIVGRKVLEQEKVNLSSGEQTVTFGVESIPNGVYQLQLFHNGVWKSQKVTIAGK